MGDQIIRTAKNKICSLTVAASLTLGPATLFSAEISWTVHDITDSATDVSTEGTLIKATSGDPGNSYEVNTVTFAAGQILDDTTRDRIAGIPTSLDDPYEVLLQRASSHTVLADKSVTFTGLTIDAMYEIQVWACNTNTFEDSALVLNDGTSSAPNPATSGHATLLYEVAAGEPGQYALGRFTADATSQSFLVRRWRYISTSPAATSEPYVNAIQIREIPPPPKGTVLVIR